MIYRCVDKALAAGVQMGLKDKYHRPHEPEITDAAKAWVVSVACTKPKDHGLAAELWTISALARFVSEGAQAAGFARLANAGKSTVWRILNENDIKPHKIRYYLEKRDPEFDRKMQEVLMVYRDVSIYSEGAVHDARPNAIYTVSVDEKPGVQAIGLTAPDLPPVPGKAQAVGRDYEYVRRGTSRSGRNRSALGHIFANVEDRHRSVEFIALLTWGRVGSPDVPSASTGQVDLGVSCIGKLGPDQRVAVGIVAMPIAAERASSRRCHSWRSASGTLDVTSLVSPRSAWRSNVNCRPLRRSLQCLYSRPGVRESINPICCCCWKKTVRPCSAA